ncbi:hypothetical protein [Herbidospora cretacea]|uniref:hypothetical protein n=1 Tax=Herbidospora cretacea TaxID=28444 RepID=UPI0004C45DA7|nr:hypothetical protein [Herbidospora cretacea]
MTTRPGSLLHSPQWWHHHWSRSGIVDVERADAMDEGWRLWLQWQHAVAPDNAPEIQAIEADQGRYLGYVRAVARRRHDVKLDDPITSIPVVYQRQPLLVDGSSTARHACTDSRGESMSVAGA